MAVKLEVLDVPVFPNAPVCDSSLRLQSSNFSWVPIVSLAYLLKVAFLFFRPDRELLFS